MTRPGRRGRRVRLGPRWRARSALAVLVRPSQELDPDAREREVVAGLARAGDLVRLLGEAGLADVVGGELSVTIALASFEDWWAPYEEPAGSVGDYLATRTPEQVGRAA